MCHAYNGQEEHLQHHGIKNMHWGVKNGPPYPLDKKVSARIKKGKNEKARFTKKELEEMLFGKLNDEGKIEPDESRLHEFFKNLSMD